VTASRRYYPGFFAALFLVLLRISIGWHFLYEGMWKLDEREGKAFSAEGYFRASAGPFAPLFRQLVPDFDGVERLKRDESGKLAALKSNWAADLERYSSHYKYDDAARKQAQDLLRAAAEEADAWALLPDNAGQLSKYAADLAHVNQLERNSLSSQYDLSWKERKKLNTTRTELLGMADGWTKALHAKWDALASESARAAGPPAAPWTMLDWMNKLTIWGLILAGAGLILGLFTRLSALWCAGFLALIYLSLPPWPGLPDNPLVEGHYLIVSKNLVEMLACLALVFLPTGHWVGLDALLFGWRARRKEAAAIAAEEEAAAGSGAGHSSPADTMKVTAKNVTVDIPKGRSDRR
jgi:uncharacterized membrane protein YphA (DoxX/SURF4 family)